MPEQITVPLIASDKRAEWFGQFGTRKRRGQGNHLKKGMKQRGARPRLDADVGLAKWHFHGAVPQVLTARAGKSPFTVRLRQISIKASQSALGSTAKSPF
ncbi:hypothetical protein [Ensifer sp. SL37]|uniref:hypothetical protein n=1 Tax=Ensifer sp. SL37 TaxID=2995137 RepID=UPI0022737233|nr:hypothetical protein [Ensifer sp. SL37]MCY1742815.1 hypothetical protein [Ensifer sp. SL37]